MKVHVIAPTYRSSCPEVFCKKGCSQKFHKIHPKIHVPETLCQAKPCNFVKKESLAQVFSCECCEFFKNIFFCRAPPVTASVRRCYYTYFHSAILKFFVRTNIDSFMTELNSLKNQHSRYQSVKGVLRTLHCAENEVFN